VVVRACGVVPVPLVAVVARSVGRMSRGRAMCWIVVGGWCVGSEDCGGALGAVVGASVNGDIGTVRGPGFEIQGLPGRGKKVE